MVWSEFELEGVDPVVVLLAMALASRRPVSSLAGGGSAGFRPVAAASDGSSRPSEAFARSPRPKNRKG